jgi:hypothetical protein
MVKRRIALALLLVASAVAGGGLALGLTACSEGRESARPSETGSSMVYTVEPVEPGQPSVADAKPAPPPPASTRRRAATSASEQSQQVCWGGFTLASVRIRAVHIQARTIPGRTIPGRTFAERTFPARTFTSSISPGEKVTLPGGTLPGGTLPAATLPATTLPEVNLPASTIPARHVPRRCFDRSAVPAPSETSIQVSNYTGLDSRFDSAASTSYWRSSGLASAPPDYTAPGFGELNRAGFPKNQYVRSYVRRDGTVVSGYWRNSPSDGLPTCRIIRC